MTVQDQIVAAANAQGISSSLALAIANQESGFNQAARGSKGEVGVFQLMPSTAAALGVNPYDLTENISGGVSYLSQLLAQYGGNVQLAVAAYNAGPGAVSKAVQSGGANWTAYIPASTRSYLSATLGLPAEPAGPQSPAPTPFVSSAADLPTIFLPFDFSPGASSPGAPSSTPAQPAAGSWILTGLLGLGLLAWALG
jgi:Transglycosylase SLT domain